MKLFKANSLSANSKLKPNIAIIGAGVIGTSTAWYLENLGFKVSLIDPQLNKKIDRKGALNGTNASLGILMGHVFRRSSGRAWELRKRSMDLWPLWIKNLSLTYKTPLIQLARSELEAISMKKLCNEKSDLGVEFLNKDHIPSILNLEEKAFYGGLISYNDGRIDPIELQKSLLRQLKENKVELIAEQVKFLHRELKKGNNRWSINLKNKDRLYFNTVIICAALGSEELINPLGHSRPIEPILGQVLDIELRSGSEFWSDWPAVLMLNGVNLIPQKKNRMLIGATLESGYKPNQICLDNMRTLDGKMPVLLAQAKQLNTWYGIRGKPMHRPAPLLEELESGLIIATGHYRNGILLAPATAEWVGNKLTN